VVVINHDRGPFVGGRIIDLSKAAAASIGMINAGTAKVRVTTTGGSALAALGEATAKAKDGASSGVTGTADIAAAEAPKQKFVTHTASRSKRAVGATASVSAKSSSGARLAAAAPKRTRGARSVRNRIDMAASQNGIRAAALQASSLSHRPVTVAWNETPYAILGAAPGFTKPSRTRARRAG
jgi:rare lipoprotein A (peptidoglycan hydrolase)